jgi:hypothetical protein
MAIRLAPVSPSGSGSGGAVESERINGDHQAAPDGQKGAP